MMEIVDAMDVPELTPSREKTEIAPINPMFSHPIGFEVRRQIYVIELFDVLTEVLVAGLLRKYSESSRHSGVDNINFGCNSGANTLESMEIMDRMGCFSKNSWK
jgi:hypothetical protein